MKEKVEWVTLWNRAEFRDAAPDVSTGFMFDDAILLAALKRIYSEDFHPMTELEENLFNEFWKNLNIAAERGLSEIPAVDYSDDFIDALRHNNAVFAAFKTHRAQNDMAARLLDADGELKSFDNWLRDVQPIADHQCRTWFQTEYDTAVKRAHAAAEWKQFEREADVLPNLEWLRTTSITPNAEHAAFWSIPVIRPINDKFWEKHRPQDRWGCKCGLRATDDEPTPDRNMPTPTENDEPSAGLNINPKDGQLFNNKTHPYSPPGKTCANCAFYNNKPTNLLHKFFNVGFPPKHCEECKNIDGAIAQATKREKTPSILDTTLSQIKELKKTLFKGIGIYEGLVSKNSLFLTGQITVLRNSLDNVAEHAGGDNYILDWAAKFNQKTSLKSWNYRGWAKNRTAKHDSYSSHFHYYSKEVDGKTYWAHVMVRYDYGETLYAIKNYKPDDLIEGIKK
ncbi:MAG: hypothetical protein LBR34_05635 [Prevotella sp.]|nr:hypothetical protein [Prevotella sp.]